MQKSCKPIEQIYAVAVYSSNIAGRVPGDGVRNEVTKGRVCLVELSVWTFRVASLIA